MTLSRPVPGVFPALVAVTENTEPSGLWLLNGVEQEPAFLSTFDKEVQSQLVNLI